MIVLISFLKEYSSKIVEELRRNLPMCRIEFIEEPTDYFLINLSINEEIKRDGNLMH